MLHKPKNACTRFWLQNARGLPSTFDGNLFRYDLTNIRDNFIHYYALPEARINTSNSDITNHLSQIHQNVFGSGALTITNTPGYPKKSRSQPGGVASGFYGRLENRYARTKKDNLGRWHYHEFFGQKNLLRIYTLYRVNPRPSTGGDTTAWAQQQTILLQNGCTENPRTQVINELLIEIEDAIDSGISVLLFADLNEGVNDSEGTNDKLHNIGMFNILQRRLGNHDLPRTHILGSKPIDHVWATINVFEAVDSAGYSPFHNVLENTDHRGIFVDINLVDILDNVIVTLKPPSQRRLQATVPARVKKYLEHVEKCWKSQNIEQRTKQIIEQTIYNGMTDDIETKLNNLDKNITEIMCHAEKKCSKLHSTVQNSWSVKFHYKLKLLHQTRNYKNRCRTMLPGQSIADAAIAYREAIKAYNIAQQEYEAIKGDDENERKLHLQTIATDKASHDGGSTTSHLTQLQHIEKQRKTNSRIKRALKPDHKKGITHVLIPARCEYKNESPDFDHHDVEAMWNLIYPNNGKDVVRWETITDKSQMETIMTNWQRRHFMQANETPLASLHWKDKFDSAAFQQSVLQGSYTPSRDLPFETREVLLHLKKCKEIGEEIAFQTTYSEFCSFIKNAKETTASSPSGRSYSHYKALLQGPPYLLRTIHSIVELCLQHGIILRRWRKTVTTLIEKDTGSPKVHRMRAIHIIESEVQFLAKTFYILKMMRLAEKSNVISDE